MAVAAVARRGAEKAGKARIRARIAHVGSEYHRDVTSGTCELCIAEWTARSRNIAVDARDIKSRFQFGVIDGKACNSFH